MNINNSPDISALDFMALFDLSGVTPHITLTNYSTGPHLNNCKWWYVITTPSQTIIHQGTAGAPDVTGNWTTITVPDAWPQPNGQVEFNIAPYVVKLYVQDSQGHEYELVRSQSIWRPSGRKDYNGNWGVSFVSMDVNCLTAKMFVNDTTNYSYSGNGGVMVSKKFVVDYPLDDTGSRPAPFELNNFVNALVPVPQSSNDYTLFLTAVYNYSFSSGIVVRIKYKMVQRFSIACGIDLCPLVCAYEKLVDEIEAGHCSTGNYEDIKDKMNLISAKMVMVLTAKQQPACGIDIPKLIEEIKGLAGFRDCNCMVGGNGNNGQLTPDSNVNYELDVECGDITGVFDTSTPGNVVLKLSNKIINFVICPGQSEAFDIEVSTNGCTKTFCLKVDLDVLKEDLDIKNYQPICVSVFEHGIDPDTAPVECPNSFFPAYIYDYTDNDVIGLAQSPADMINLLNTNSSWSTKGTAYVVGNCRVCFSPNAGITSISPVYITKFDPGEPPVSPDHYNIQVNDYCQNTQPVPLSQFPQNVYAQYQNGGTIYNIGYATSYADMIVKINAHANKPANITAAGTTNSNPTLMLVDVTDSNVPAGKYLKLFGEKPGLILYGGNSSYGNPGSTTTGNIDVVYMDTNVRLGKVCKATLEFYKPWHVIVKDNLLTFIESDTGSIKNIDVSDPLNPIMRIGYQLDPRPYGAPNTPFSGVPVLSGSKPSHWDTYFPTDYNAQFRGNETYLVESTSGTIYKYIPSTNSWLGGFFSDRLYGLCPRVIYNNKLYLTRDGSRGNLTGAGQFNPIPLDHLVIIDLNSFSPGFITTVELDPGEEPWSMSVNPANKDEAFIVFKSGNVYRYNMATDAGVNLYSTVTPSLAAADLVNTCIYAGVLYITAFGVGSYFCPLHVLGPGIATVFAPLPTTPGPTNVRHFNFRPIPDKCFGLVTYDNGTNNGGVARYSLDGQYQGKVEFPGSMYNVVPILGVLNPTPNTICP